MYDAVKTFQTACKLIGAGRAYYACHRILEAQNNSKTLDLTGYPLLVETAIELKRYIWQYLAFQQGNAYEESKDIGNIPLASGFKVAYVPDNDLYYCIAVESTLKERMRVREGERLKSNQESTLKASKKSSQDIPPSEDHPNSNSSSNAQKSKESTGAKNSKRNQNLNSCLEIVGQD